MEDAGKVFGVFVAILLILFLSPWVLCKAWAIVALKFNIGVTFTYWEMFWVRWGVSIIGSALFGNKSNK